MPNTHLREEIGKKLDKWLLQYVPSDVDKGLKNIKERILQYLAVATVDLVSTVKIWCDYEKPSLYKFEYLYLEDGAAILGQFYIDTKYWDIGKPAKDKEC